MIIKVCGMKNPENIRELNELPVDYMGMIFYEKSPRYINNLEPEAINSFFKKDRKRVGVFVNAEADYINGMIDKYELDLVQLHGKESASFCKLLTKGIPIIKAFSIADSSDFDQTKNYEGVADFFLFDTKTPQYGGSGLKFDWNILNEYKGDTPFLLSGGISAEDANTIKKIQHPKLYGIDLNSRFETEPGLKDIELLAQFIKRIKDEQN